MRPSVLIRSGFFLLALTTTTLIAQSSTVIGTGCTDSFGRISVLSANLPPTIGQSAFNFDLAMAPPNQTTLCFLSLLPASPPLSIGSGCNIYLDVASFNQLIALGISPIGPNSTSPMGQTSFGFPIPNLPQLNGLSLYAQAATVDAISLGFVVSNGLQITFG